MASEGELECLLSLSFLRAKQLSTGVFSPSPDVPEEDANEHIFNVAQLSDVVQGS